MQKALFTRFPRLPSILTWVIYAIGVVVRWFYITRWHRVQMTEQQQFRFAFFTRADDHIRAVGVPPDNLRVQSQPSGFGGNQFGDLNFVVFAIDRWRLQQPAAKVDQVILELD